MNKKSFISRIIQKILVWFGFTSVEDYVEKPKVQEEETFKQKLKFFKKNSDDNDDKGKDEAEKLKQIGKVDEYDLYMDGNGETYVFIEGRKVKYKDYIKDKEKAKNKDKEKDKKNKEKDSLEKLKEKKKKLKEKENILNLQLNKQNLKKLDPNHLEKINGYRDLINKIGREHGLDKAGVFEKSLMQQGVNLNKEMDKTALLKASQFTEQTFNLQMGTVANTVEQAIPVKEIAEPVKAPQLKQESDINEKFKEKNNGVHVMTNELGAALLKGVHALLRPHNKLFSKEEILSKCKTQAQKDLVERKMKNEEFMDERGTIQLERELNQLNPNSKDKLVDLNGDNKMAGASKAAQTQIDKEHSKYKSGIYKS